MRDLIGLACDGCKRRNYTTSKNKKRQPDKFGIKKFCPFCRPIRYIKKPRFKRAAANWCASGHQISLGGA